MIVNERSMSASDYATAIERSIECLAPDYWGANFMIFNERLLDDNSGIKLIGQTCQNAGFDASLTMLFDFRMPHTADQLEHLRRCGFSGIKFHSYVQQIISSEFREIVSVARIAEDLGMMICIDTSYGGLDLYRCDNLALAVEICRHLKTAPIVLLHSGGARVLEAMLLAESQANVYLETSFSVPYYLTSTVEQDLAFAYHKVGTHRVLYGSDHPYIPVEEALSKTHKFLTAHGFSEDEQRDVFTETAGRLLPAVGCRS